MIGELATSKAGHDKDRLYMIVGEEGECVYLCDGRLRGVEHPKKKKKKHIQIIHSSAQDTLIQIIKQNLPGERDEIDSIISKFSNKRTVERIPKINLAILRLAIYEAIYEENVPVNVAISEAVALAGKYALEPDVSFVNGVLGSFAKEQEEKQ